MKNRFNRNCVIIIFLSVVMFLLAVCSTDLTDEGFPVSKMENKGKYLTMAVRLLFGGCGALIVIAFVLFIVSAGGAFAQNYNSERDFTIEIINEGKGICITDYNGKSKDVIIPSRIQNLPVTEIGENAFRWDRIISVNIPDSVISIGDKAFAYNQLTSVNIPDSVIFIGGGAFASNPISEIVIAPANPAYQVHDMTLMSKDGKLLLAYFGTEKNYTIPDSVTEIGNMAFYENQLTGVNIPDSVTTIGHWAFAHNQLTSVTIPDSVKSIGYWAFAHNQLTSITVSDSVASIELLGI